MCETSLETPTRPATQTDFSIPPKATFEALPSTCFCRTDSSSELGRANPPRTKGRGRSFRSRRSQTSSCWWWSLPRRPHRRSRGSTGFDRNQDCRNKAGICSTRPFCQAKPHTLYAFVFGRGLLFNSFAHPFESLRQRDHMIKQAETNSQVESIAGGTAEDWSVSTGNAGCSEMPNSPDSALRCEGSRVCSSASLAFSCAVCFAFRSARFARCLSTRSFFSESLFFWHHVRYSFFSLELHDSSNGARVLSASLASNFLCSSAVNILPRNPSRIVSQGLTFFIIGIIFSILEKWSK